MHHHWFFHRNGVMPLFSSGEIIDTKYHSTKLTVTAHDFTLMMDLMDGEKAHN